MWNMLAVGPPRSEITPEKPFPTSPAASRTTLSAERDTTSAQSTFAGRISGGSPLTEIPTGAGCGHCGDPRGPGSCSMN